MDALESKTGMNGLEVKESGNKIERHNDDCLGEYSRGWTGEQDWHEWPGSEGDR